MLTARIPSDEAYFDELRAREFGRLARTGEAYLDYTGSALYADSQVRAHAALMAGGLFGNPHSEHRASRASAAVIEDARRRTLEWLDADEASYDVCFTSNATAAIKLVAESYPFAPDVALVLTADNHNSVNGIREYAARAGSRVVYLPLDGSLRLSDPVARLECVRRDRGLFAFPAQSNFSGVQHPLSLVTAAQSLGFEVLLDAASYVPGHTLSLRRHPATFVPLSFYKMFGYPTGVGALVARRDALARLRRPWFSGGTVEFASVQLDTYRRRTGHEGFEDGTPDFLAIAALDAGFDVLSDVTMPRLTAHVGRLTHRLLEDLGTMRHSNGAPLVHVYGPGASGDRGGTVTFTVWTSDRRPVPYWMVEERAVAARIAVRGGCFCNPGASEAAFHLPARASARCFASADGPFSVQHFSECLGGATPVGAVRASVGLATNRQDVQRLVDVIAAFRE
jgi:selenocysteine lyase/cysteine desulfurase